MEARLAAQKILQIEDVLKSVDESVTLISAFTETEENKELLSKLIENIDDVKQIVSSVDLMETTTEDINKGTFLGSRKLDIDLALNKTGIAETINYNDALAVWNNTANTVYYNKATCTFVDGEVIVVNFVNDDAQGIQVSTHGAIVDQLNKHVAFTAKLDNTAILEEVGGRTGTLIRIVDVTGTSSNVERIQLHATSGAFVSGSPIYYWALTTSALQTLANRVGDIIALGNDIDKIIVLSSRIDEMLDLRSSLTELLAIHTNLSELLLARSMAATATEKAGIATTKAQEASVSAQTATTKAQEATNAAQTATAKANEIKNVSVGQTITAASGTPASVVYNPTTGKFTFVVPQGFKGDRGEALTIDARGTFAQRALYDTQIKDFSYLSVDVGLLYFKKSNTSGDWDDGFPFGKGDQGLRGVSISGIARTAGDGSAGTTDTYTIYYDDATTDIFEVTNGTANLITSVAGRTGDITLTTADIEGLEAALSSVETAVIVKPSIVSPSDNAIDFTGSVSSSAYASSNSYQGTHDFTHWQVATDSAFTSIVDEETVGNLTSFTPSIGLALTKVYVRVRHGSDNHLSAWSDTISFTTPNIYIQTPTLTVTGTPSDVAETPTLTTSAFSVYNGSDTHASTDWEVRKQSDDSLVWSSPASTTNKLSITVPAGILQVSTAYVFKARHNSATYGSSAYVSVNGTTKSAFTIPIGIAGAMDFGVAPSSEAWAALGLAEMSGTTTAGHDNYGNYIHTNGSIMVHIPKFYYRVGNASAPQYATYGVNSLEIAGTDTFSDEASANAAGYALHRAFIDGGAVKGGFFIDKYLASKKVGDTNVAVSVKNGNPIGLTTNATYTPSSTMTGCTGILADAVTLSRARGSYFNTASVFMYAAIALLSVAHGQKATSTSGCAWYDASRTMNFPKGCNNGSRADVNDTSVTWSASPDTAAKGLTGSASTFAKSTHNGQNNGIADVNGLMYQVALGMTNIGTSATDTAAIASNLIYLLKQSVALKSLTAGWDGATDAWGQTAHLSALYDQITSPIEIATTGASYWGSGTNAVFSTALSGVGRDTCGLLPKDNSAYDATGTNMCGGDYMYRYNRSNMFPYMGGGWSYAAMTGVFFRVLNSARSTDGNSAGFRVAAYI